ncbi:mutT motif protein [Lumpy skin disease virus]|uniref:MutT motif protein n=1 Tax=Lumpy skin disease virus TaxID=59509 RepID=A0A7D4ZM67_LSDV|nr:mutT motif protein [Lumpy skin disease virus]QKS68709.1 mutT motif protein [Lumpy skin disease virus]QKS68866.1 mutT motif protein [Lumpy skin disease virus]QKS69023.1 mutT motif protein [Lumpy skin disease virus]QKS69180.1 mutT motif protein [Lumpy skin disease virus]
MDNYYPSSLFNDIIKRNRKLSKTYILSSNNQKIYVTGFNNQSLDNIKKVSISIVMLTSDNKFLACSRRHSFLFTEIIRSKNIFRKRRLFLKYSNFLKKNERIILSSELDIKLSSSDHENDFSNIIFPGGVIRNEEDVIKCLSREIKEEVNIDSKDIFLDYRFFIHMLIEDLLTDRFYENILFFGKTFLTSNEIIHNFFSNKEIKSLVFFDSLYNGIEGDIIRFVLDISRLKCFGNKGYKLYNKNTFKSLKSFF